MQRKIKILDKKTINQIAAGEVVERPASVVKELVENALDAKSTKIVIELEVAGKKSIRVTDNGSGISADELKLAFEKHSTSKISTIDDIYKLSTMGFRGEALASIAAVARVECISNDGSSLTGNRLVIEGGIIKNENEVGCAQGTTIKVKELFFNLPARLKYLKSDQTELTHIIDVVTHLAIYHYQINFKLIHNGNELLNFPKTSNQLNNLVNIYGKELVRNLVPVQVPDEFMESNEQSIPNLTIFGYLGKPSVTRNDRAQQTIYVNGRYVESDVISNAIKSSYRTLVMKHRHPVVILFIELDPGAMDINISPTKLLIRFENEEKVYNQIFSTLKGTLKSHDLIPEVKVASKPQTVSLKAITTFGPGKPGTFSKLPMPPKQTNRNIMGGTLKQSIFRPGIIENVSECSEIKASLDLSEEYKESNVATGLINIKGTMLPNIQPIGQILDTYVIAQAESNLLIIDQHAAHERIMYEKIKRRYNSQVMSTQELLEPIELELTPRELGLLKTSLKTLTELNFVIDEMGADSFFVKGIPIILGKLQSPELLHDIINNLITVTQEKEHEQIKDKMMQIMACKAAIKAGRPLNIPEIYQLLRELYSIENPYTCAHGRPTIISLTENQLKKLFKRIV